jgi:hypothetical protein
MRVDPSFGSTRKSTTPAGRRERDVKVSWLFVVHWIDESENALAIRREIKDAPREAGHP